MTDFVKEQIEKAVANYGEHMNKRQGAEYVGLSRQTWYRLEKKDSTLPKTNLPNRYLTSDIVTWNYREREPQERSWQKTKLPEITGIGLEYI